MNSCVLIRNEDTPTFEWCFRCFAEVFRTPPVAFFTDGDTAMARALRLAIPARCYQWTSMSSFRLPISVNSSSERFSCCRRRCLRAGLRPRRRPVARNFALSVRVSHLEELCQEAEAPVCSQRALAQSQLALLEDCKAIVLTIGGHVGGGLGRTRRDGRVPCEGLGPQCA